MDQAAYFNALMVRLEELFYHELSDCASWKTELIGIDFIQSKNIRGDTPKKIIENCIQEITAAGLVREMSYAIAGRDILLQLAMKDCIHFSKEIKIKANGIRPYNCPIANMIRDQLIEKLAFETTFIADINIDEKKKACKLRVAIYETPDKIGEVSDWSTE